MAYRMACDHSVRTVTVIAAGSVGLPYQRALPALIAGSSVFLQGLLLVGLALGAPIRAVLEAGTAPVVGIVLTVVLSWLVVRMIRRRRRARASGVTGALPDLIEGACPACLAIGVALARYDVARFDADPARPAVPPEGGAYVHPPSAGPPR